MDPINSESAVKVVTSVRPLLPHESDCKDIITILLPGKVGRSPTAHALLAGSYGVGHTCRPVFPPQPQCMHMHNRLVPSTHGLQCVHNCLAVTTLGAAPCRPSCLRAAMVLTMH